MIKMKTQHRELEMKPKPEQLEAFDLVRVKFRKMGGIVRGLHTEFSHFVKKHKDWKTCLPKLMVGLELEEKIRKQKASRKEFVPGMKHFQTWINGRWWEIECGKSRTEIRDAIDKRQAQVLLDIEKARIQMRNEEGTYFQERTTEELTNMLNDSNMILRHWLIKEVLADKENPI